MCGSGNYCFDRVGRRGGPKLGFFGSQRLDQVRQARPTSTASAAHPIATISAAHPRSKVIVRSYPRALRPSQRYRPAIHRNQSFRIKIRGLVVSNGVSSAIAPAPEPPPERHSTFLRRQRGFVCLNSFPARDLPGVFLWAEMQAKVEVVDPVTDIARIPQSFAPLLLDRCRESVMLNPPI
jgi:hypothetical protein